MMIRPPFFIWFKIVEDGLCYIFVLPPFAIHTEAGKKPVKTDRCVVRLTVIKYLSSFLMEC